MYKNKVKENDFLIVGKTFPQTGEGAREEHLATTEKRYQGLTFDGVGET